MNQHLKEKLEGLIDHEIMMAGEHLASATRLLGHRQLKEALEALGYAQRHVEAAQWLQDRMHEESENASR